MPPIETMGMMVNSDNSPNTRALGGVLKGIIRQLNSLADDIAKIESQLGSVKAELDQVKLNTTPKPSLSGSAVSRSAVFPTLRK